MEAETLAGLFGLGGALVGAAVSTGAVIWQQRKTAHEAERSHLLGLSEAAANEVIRLTYVVEDHFAKDAGDKRSPDGRQWHCELQIILRDPASEVLRFPDRKVRHLVQWGHAEIIRDPEGVAHEEASWPTARYRDIYIHFRTAMGTVSAENPSRTGYGSSSQGLGHRHDARRQAFVLRASTNA
ncbi:hypothetical protein [Streptomyces erythrochromogenes]|uniref:hypothetical protein n=1 Tax=Streptomyces erythrochromogenes TaxID=285574 RepID=UPI0036C0B9D9